MKNSLQTLIHSVACLVLTLGAIAQGYDQKIDPTGTWTWTTTRNDQTRTSTLKLKLEGDKVTGSLTGGRGGEATVNEGKLKGDEISFKVTREFNGNQFTQKYTGKISGDTIKGKIEFERDGQAQSREWEAKREGGAKAANLTGKWKYSFTTSGGQTLEPVLDLKQEGNKLTGKVTVNERVSEISDAKIENGEVSFKVVREREGQTFTSKYNGKLEGDVFKGKINSNFGGNDRTFDFEAKRVKE